MADIFLSFAGLILVLIVLASPNDDPKIWRSVDLIARCVSNGDSSWGVSDANGTDRSIADFITHTSRTGLFQRVGLHVRRDQLTCYKEVDFAVRTHNRELLSRGSVAASLGLVFLSGETDG